MHCGEGLWWLLVVCGWSAVLGAAGDRDARSCASVHDFFRLANLSADEPPPPPHDAHNTESETVCGGACCSARREAALRARVRRDFSALAAHTSRALQSLLSTTRHTLHDHVMELSKQSQNKTHMLFAQVYKSMSIHAHKPIDELYSDIRHYIESNRTDLGSPPTVDLEKSAANFFREIFPLVYHKAAKQDWQDRDFTADYKSCLREAYKDIEPFGDIPKHIAASLSKSLEATRVLLEALALGAEVLTASDALLAEEWGAGGAGGACHAALLRMSYCGKCRGLLLHAKPCAGYCLNVLRGCVTWRVAELDAPWNSFVEGVQRLVTAERGPDGRAATGDAALRPLDSRISEAIMHAMENGINLEKKVKHACGHARLAEASSEGGTPGALSRAAGAGLARRDQLRVSPPDTQITHFLASIDKSKGFYVNLADSLCQDESFAEQAEGQACWNGENIGEYTKAVVGPGASFQKYNPEVAVPAAADDPRVAALADKLRHVRLVLVSQVSRSTPSAESFSYMQGDEAGGGGGGGEGSGSGRDDYSDGEDDNYDAEGSGEGSGAIESTETKSGTSVRTMEPKTGGACSWRASQSQWSPLYASSLLLLPVLRRALT